MIEQSTHVCRRIVIDDSRIDGFMGQDMHVHATPQLLSDVAMTCWELRPPMVEPGPATAHIVHRGYAAGPRRRAGHRRRISLAVGVSNRSAVCHDRAVVNVERLNTPVRALQDAAQHRSAG